MNVQDAISAFDFLSKFNWLAFIFLITAISIVTSFFVVNIIDKLYDDKNKKREIIAFTILFIVASMCVLKYQAALNNEYTCKANNIKAYLLKQDEYNCGYVELANRVNFDDNDNYNDEEKRKEIKKITGNFPEVFAQSKIIYPEFQNDTDGVQLVDTKLYDMRSLKLLPLFKAKILYYMRSSNCDTLNFQRIQNTIDDRCDNYVLDMLIAKDPKLFISIVAPYDIYYKGKDTVTRYGGDMALRISQDSVKKYLCRK